MRITLEMLTQNALRLSPKERIILAESLLLTVNESDACAIDSATWAELEQRLRDLETGSVEGILAEKALAEIRASLPQSA